MKRLAVPCAAASMTLLVFSESPCRAQFCTANADCIPMGNCVRGVCEPIATADSAETTPPTVLREPSTATTPRSVPAPSIYVSPHPAPATVTGFPSTAMANTSAGRSRFFAHAYLSVSGWWAGGGAGGYNTSAESNGDTDSSDESIGSSSVQTGHGLHISAYLVPAHCFHIGVFIDWLAGRMLHVSDGGDRSVDDFDQIGTGLALKAGGGAGRAFVSFAGDIGFASILLPSAQAQRGLLFHPRLQIDVMAVRDDPFKVAVFAAFGAAISVVVGYDEAEEDKTVRWAVTPALQIGGAFGG